MSESPVEFPVKVFLYAAGSVAVFGIMNICAKMAAEQASVAQIIFFRSFFAFFPILFMIRNMGGLKLIKTKQHLGHFWRGSIGLLAMACFFGSFAMLPMANATAIHFAQPLLLTMLSIPLLGEKVGILRWGAVVVGLGGVLLMLDPSATDAIEPGKYLLGSGIAFCAAFLSAFAMIFVRKLGATEHALTIVFYFTLYGSIYGAVGMVFMWQPLDTATLGLLVGAGLLGGIAQILLTYAYTCGPASYVAPFSYLSMVFAIGADIVIWSVWPDWRIYAGCFIITASGLFIVYREVQKKKRVEIRPNIYSMQPVMPTKADRKRKKDKAP